MSEFEVARQGHKPDEIKVLLIAEAPPRLGSGRFFYFENVSSGDSLFLETMKVLYGEHLTATDIRPKKREFLRRFVNDGFYLIDATDNPMPKGASDRQKRSLLAEALPDLQRKVKQLVDNRTPIILISKSVFDVCREPIHSDGYRVLNREMIDFPGSGRQIRFRGKFRDLLPASRSTSTAGG